MLPPPHWRLVLNFCKKEVPRPWQWWNPRDRINDFPLPCPLKGQNRTHQAGGLCHQLLDQERNVPTLLSMKVTPSRWPARMPTGRGSSSLIVRRSHTLQIASSPPENRMWELVSAKATAFTSSSWDSIYRKVRLSQTTRNCYHIGRTGWQAKLGYVGQISSLRHSLSQRWRQGRMGTPK